MDVTAQYQKAPLQLTRGYLVCLAAVVFLSTTGILIRYLTETYHIPPLVLAFWRAFFLVVALMVVFGLANPQRLRVAPRHLSFLLLYGLEISLFNSLWTISVALNGAAAATVLAYSSAAFTAVLGWWLFAERLGLLKGFTVIFSLIGCVLVADAFNLSSWEGNPVGILTGLLSGLAYALYSLMGKAASQRSINPWTTLTYSFAFAVPFLLAYNLIPGWLPEGVACTDLLWLGRSLDGWGILIFLAVGPTVGGFGLYMLSLAYLPASVANLIATLEPVNTALLAFLFLGERFSGPQWAGGLLIVSGLVLLRVSEGRRGGSR